MRVIGSRIASALVAAAMLFVSAAGVAASAAPVPSPEAAQASWLALSMLSSSGTVGLAGAAGAQPATDVLPPPPGPRAPEENAYNGVPLPVIGIWLAGTALAVYILTRNHRGRFSFPNSPG